MASKKQQPKPSPKKGAVIFEADKLAKDLLSYRMDNGVIYQEIIDKTGMNTNSVFRVESGTASLTIALPVICIILCKKVDDYITVKK